MRAVFEEQDVSLLWSEYYALLPNLVLWQGQESVSEMTHQNFALLSCTANNQKKQRTKLKFKKIPQELPDDCMA